MFRASTAAGLVVSLSVSSASGQRTFSQGIPNFPFTAAEQEIYNYILSTTAAMGTINHFWSTACGGRQINYATEGGIAVYRIYIDGELNASIEFTPRSAVGYGPFDPAAGSASLSSLHEPWSTDLWGKLSDMDGFFFKVKIPFYRSIRVTAQLPAGVAAFNVYTIIRGVESDDTGLPALSLPGYGALPLGTRMLQIRNDNITIPNLGFIPIVNISSGSGLIYAHAVSIVGNPGLLYLEGCFHLITPVGPTASYDNATGVAPGFPGAVLSTGTEDYYSSSFYFHAGLFAAHDTGVPHMCATSNSVAPPCADTAVSEWSAYRVHDTDPMLFTEGAQLLMRNGDKPGPTPYGSAKCYNLDMVPDGMSPGPSVVSTMAWVYLFP